MAVTLGRPSGSEGPLNESKNRFAEFLAAFGAGHGLKEFLATETLHLAEDFLDRAPIGNACLSHSYCSLDEATQTVLPLTLRVQG